MKRADLYVVTAIVVVALAAATGVVWATAYHTPSPSTVAAATSPAQTPAAKPMHLTWTIATPDMLKSSVGPALLPAGPSLPADSDVTVTVTNFDDATALAAGTERYATATGIVGQLTVQAMDTTNPNAPGSVTTVSALDPATGVSHTVTVPELGLNVPIAPKATTTFTFHTGRAGAVAWQCFDPCGSDPNGWGGAMATAGFMKGTVMTCGSCAVGAACC